MHKQQLVIIKSSNNNCNVKADLWNKNSNKAYDLRKTYRRGGSSIRMFLLS